MATVHRRPASPYFHAAFRGPDGRRILRSTKQTDRNKALAVALEWERAAKLAKRGELVEAQAREVVKDIMARADIGETIQTVSIADYFRDWLASKEERKSAGTAARYGGTVNSFLAGLGLRITKPLASLTGREVDRYLDARLKSGVAPSTAVLDVKIIRTALNMARRKGLILTNPAEAVELPEVQSVERGTFTSVEVGILVREARGEWPTLILLAYYTGARLSDCARMAWESVNLSARSLTYTQSKTGRKLTVPLHPDLLAHLEELAGTDRPDPFIMPGMAALKPGGQHGLSEGFKRIMRKAGVDTQTVQGAGVRRVSKRTFHALRHSFNSALANAGVDQELRMKLTGQDSKEINRGYTHHEFENLHAAIGKLPSLRAKV